MQLSSKPTLSVLAACALIYTIYLPIALWLQHSYVPPPYAPLAPRIQQWPLQKIHPLEGFAFVSALDRFVSLEDDKAEQHSPVVLYEDGKPLGPAHSLHGDIEHIGHGRYSHWKGAGIIRKLIEIGNLLKPPDWARQRLAGSLSTTLGRPLARFGLGSLRAFALPVLDIGEPFPVSGYAPQALGLAGIALFQGLAGHSGSPVPEIWCLGHKSLQILPQ